MAPLFAVSLAAGACASRSAPPARAPLSRAAAVAVLETTDVFADTAVGFDGGPSPQACAFAALLRESDAGALFRSLLTRSGTAGQLYALCGLYLTDPPAFTKEVEAFRTRDDEVRTLFGCIGGRRRVRDVVEHSGPRAVRLSSPKETLQAWVKRDPEGGRSFFLDIYGGGYPATFRAMRPCR